MLRRTQLGNLIKKKKKKKRVEKRNEGDQLPPILFRNGIQIIVPS